MLQLILIAAVLVALFYYYCIKPLSYWKDLGVKQGKKSWFFGDNFRQILQLESIADMIVRLYNEFPEARYVGIYEFTSPALFIKDPELIKQICVKDFDHFLDHRTFLPKNSDPLFTKNLFALKGQKWRDMRPVLSPSFTSSKMKGIFLLMRECAENFNNHFLKKNQDIVEVDIKDSFTRYANDVIATTAFGIKTDSLEEQTNEFYMMGMKATNFGSFSVRMKFIAFILMPKICEWLNISLFEKSVSRFFKHIIETNIETRKKQGIIRQDMLHLLIESQKDIQQRNEKKLIDNAQELNSEQTDIREMTNIDIAAQAMIFFFAGFEAISTQACFVAYELAVHQDVQNRLREEVEQTLEKCGRTLTYEGLLKMKYMDMVLSESLRKWTGPVADRVCTKPYTIQPTLPDEKPVYLEKGSILLLPIYGLHHDPALFSDPERFDPERFSDENKGNINPFAYIPFGSGPRSCIANRFALLEIKVVIFYILSKFEIVPIAKTAIPLRISKSQMNIFPVGGFPLGLKRLAQ